MCTGLYGTHVLLMPTERALEKEINYTCMLEIKGVNDTFSSSWGMIMGTFTFAPLVCMYYQGYL